MRSEVSCVSGTDGGRISTIEKAQGTYLQATADAAPAKGWRKGSFMKTSRNRRFREHRRALQVVEDLARRSPLSPAQRERLDRATRALRSSLSGELELGIRQLRQVVADVAITALELMDGAGK